MAPLIAMQLVQSTLRHGLSNMWCVGVATLTLILCAEGRDPKPGLRLGHLSVSLANKFDSKEWIPCAHSHTHTSCFLLRKPACNCLNPLLMAHCMGLRTGDVEHSNFATGLCSGLVRRTSLPLQQVIDVVQSTKCQHSIPQTQTSICHELGRTIQNSVCSQW